MTSKLSSNKVYRDTLCEVLNEMSTGRHIENHECLKTIALLIKHTLTCKLYQIT